MALTAWNIMDMDDILFVVWVNEAVGEGAIGRIDVTARQGTIVAWAIYQGTVVSQTVAGGTTWSRTFAGNSAKAGDVQAVGIGVMP